MRIEAERAHCVKEEKSLAVELTLERQAGALALEAYVIGDVRPVIHSRADRLNPLPQAVTHGLGALSTDGPSSVGEGIVVRGWAGSTPPTARAGVKFSYQPTLERISTPFFAGWAGSPLTTGRFVGGAGATVRQLYEAVFAEVSSYPGLADSSVLFLEIAGLFPAAGIYDRALKAPVHTGDVLITDAEYAQRYFTFKIIQQDLLARDYPIDHLVPLLVVGMGFKPGMEAPDLQRFEQAAFYEPPKSTQGVGTPQTPGVKTHSHALGWRDQAVLSEHLAQAYQRSNWQAAFRAVDEQVLPDVLASPPDYVVHLDEWSQMLGGVVRVFALAAPETMTFIPV